MFNGLKRKLSRIFALLLCLFILAACVLSPAASLPPARASSSAASAEASLEVLALLYSLLSTAGTASGMEEGLTDYEKGYDLLDAFVEFGYTATVGAAPPGAAAPEAFTVELEDGSVVAVTWNDMMTTLQSVQLQPKPDDVTDATGEYIRMLFVAGLIASGGESPEPDKEPEDPFTKIQKFSISAGTSLQIASFFEKLQNGEIEGLEPEDYYGNWFDGTYERDAEGNYVVKGTVTDYFDDTWADGIHTRTYSVEGFIGSGCRPALYFFEDSQGRSFLRLMYLDEGTGVLYENTGTWFRNTIRCIWVLDNGDIGTDTDALGFLNKCFKDEMSYSFNLPVFESRDSAAAFLQGGDAADAAGMANLQPYDFPGLAASLLNVLAPVLNANLSPQQMLDVNAAVSEAVKALPQPEPGSSPQENAAVYEQAVTDAVSDAVPDPEPSPDPDREPSPSAQETAKKYRRDLTMVFPFCIPFDLIRFFKAMNAEPVAPCFHFPFVVEPLGIDMDVELDMAFLEPAMQVFRLGELGLFIIGLILVTGKVIKW